jgi:hypothetical protein
MMKCNSCQLVRINGIVCHEIGCPDVWKDYERVCKWCGNSFKPELKHQDYCCTDCNEAYRGY